MFGTGGISHDLEKVLECCTSCTSTNTPYFQVAQPRAQCTYVLLCRWVVVPSEIDLTHCLVRALVLAHICTYHVHIGHIRFAVFDQPLQLVRSTYSLHAGRCMRPAISGAHRSPIRTIGTKYCVVISLACGIRAKNQFERRMRPVTFHLTVEPCIVAFDYTSVGDLFDLCQYGNKKGPSHASETLRGRSLIIESRLARHKIRPVKS